MGKLPDQREKEKKDKHVMNFHEQRKHLSLFVLSVDGMNGKEALVVLMNLRLIMA